jgi:NAD(P)-dependent dehydrogenase (short-subunit alcohol dehydrogenase family)
MPTTTPTLSFNCAVITGGAGGLGRAMAGLIISLSAYQDGHENS